MPIDMSDAVLKLLKLPLKYDTQGQTIYDADTNRVLDLRGWGWVQYKFKTEAQASRAHDAFGRRIMGLIETEARRIQGE